MGPMRATILVFILLAITDNSKACKRKWKNLKRDLNSDDETKFSCCRRNRRGRDDDVDKPKPSLSTVLFGETGCQLTCNLLSQLYGSTTRPTTRNLMYCDCNEMFTVNGRQINNDKFKSLPFNSLWDYWFEKSPTSNGLRNRIQRNTKMQEFVLPLMRNSHLTGNEIKQLIMDEYPQLKQMQSVQVNPRGKKEQVAKAAFEVDYDNLDQAFPDLFENARSQVAGIPYQTRLDNLLNTLSKDDLEFVKSGIRKTGRDALIQIVDDFTGNPITNADRVLSRGRNKRPPKRQTSGTTATDENKKPKNDDDADFSAYEREMIELKVVNDLLNAADGVQKTLPPAQDVKTPTTGERLAKVNQKIKNTVSERLPQIDTIGKSNLDFIKPAFANNLGDSIRKNIQDNIKRQQEQMEALKEKASQPNADGEHTVFDYNSVSNKVVSSAVDGKQTQVEEAEVKTVHKDSDRPEEDKDKDFGLNAVSVKNKAQNVNNKVIHSVDNDNIKGSSKVQERIKNGSKEFVIIHDGGAAETSQTQKPPLNAANIDGLDDLKSSTYYLVFDEEGNMVHTSNAENPLDNQEKITQKLLKNSRFR